MNKNSLYVILAILVFTICIRHFQGCAIETTPSLTIDTKPKPSPKVVVPEPKPQPEHLAIVYDDIDKAKNIAEHYDKKLVLVFSAEWCPFCKKLKSDLDILANKNSYVICLIDIEKNKKVVQQYQLKTLPTSIVLDNNKEMQRTSGYNRTSYSNWLKSI